MRTRSGLVRYLDLPCLFACDFQAVTGLGRRSLDLCAGRGWVGSAEGVRVAAISMRFGSLRYRLPHLLGPATQKTYVGEIIVGIEFNSRTAICIACVAASCRKRKEAEGFLRVSRKPAGKKSFTFYNSARIFYVVGARSFFFFFFFFFTYFTSTAFFVPPTKPDHWTVPNNQEASII